MNVYLGMRIYGYVYRNGSSVANIKKAWQEYRRHYAINNLSKPLIFNRVKSLLRAKFPTLGERYALRNHKCNQQKFAKLGFSLPDYVPKLLL